MSRLRPNVLAAKQRLADGNEQFRRRHDEGCPGLELCAALTDLRDEVLLELFEAALEETSEDGSGSIRNQIALVPHGGYGRRDVSPGSDVDLMVLHAPSIAGEAGRLGKRLFLDVCDAGLLLGHSLRTPRQACRLGAQDAVIGTSLIEARLLIGSEKLFQSFVRPFRQLLRRRSASLMAAIEQARADERLKYGETVYLLEPNLKRSRGGLRDIQLLRWIGMVRYGSSEPEELRRMEAISDEDCRVVVDATEFLLRLRNELHFHAGRSSDVLHRGEQLRIAELWGYDAAAGMLPVERFMQEYFRHTDQVSHVVGRFVAKSRYDRGYGPVWTAVFGHHVGRDFRVGPTQIRATRHGLRQIQKDLSEVMRLADLANLYDKQIAPDTWEVIARAAPKYPSHIPPAARDRFLAILDRSTRLGELLRALHEVGLLERFIPAFTHARGLLQFNQYHKFTVDEHCLRAVEEAIRLNDDDGPLGRVYRALEQKRILHLALLIHDLGKGFAEDHCKVGVRIAEETAARLAIPARQGEALSFLVEKHLVMNHLAFRRDTDDEQVIVEFAVEVGSPELLQMLYVMTAADMGAVGPGTWTSWKADVLTDLYHRTMQHLAGDSPSTSIERHLALRREEILARVDNQASRGWFDRQVEALPNTYLNATEPQQIAADLCMLHKLQDGQVAVSAEFQRETETLLLTVAAHEQVAPGIFHRLTGAVTGEGLEILTAQINTLEDGLVLDRFWARDPDFAGEPPPQRLAAISKALQASLTAPGGGEPSFRRTWRVGGQPPAMPTAQTRVRVDNHTSQQCTILDIFAADRLGLLYRVTRTIFEMGLSVSRAKIGTFGDQVVDVFYVTDLEGRKIQDDGRLDQIRQRLTEVIDEMGKTPAGA